MIIYLSCNTRSDLLWVPLREGVRPTILFFPRTVVGAITIQLEYNTLNTNHTIYISGPFVVDVTIVAINEEKHDETDFISEEHARRIPLLGK